MNEVEFLSRIAPELIKLGHTLYERHGDDVKAALYDIADRRAEIAQNRAERDTQLDDKHGGK